VARPRGHGRTDTYAHIHAHAGGYAHACTGGYAHTCTGERVRTHMHGRAGTHTYTGEPPARPYLSRTHAHTGGYVHTGGYAHTCTGEPPARPYLSRSAHAHTGGYAHTCTGERVRTHTRASHRLAHTYLARTHGRAGTRAHARASGYTRTHAHAGGYTHTCTGEPPARPYRHHRGFTTVSTRNSRWGQGRPLARGQVQNHR
jgi:hypothetical protein